MVWDSCLLFVGVGTDGHCNFSTMHSPVELNLVETLGWYPRLVCMFWFQDSIVFHIINKQNKKTRRNREKRSFNKLEFSLPYQVRLIWNLVGTSVQVLGIVWFVLYILLFVYGGFHDWAYGRMGENVSFKISRNYNWTWES
jgi:hypothetical protein